MEFDAFRAHCLALKCSAESLPFDRDTLVFKVLDKVFALTPLSTWEAGAPTVNLKCEPEKARILLTQYRCVQPGYHMNKKHWNTLQLNTGELQEKQIFEFIDESYRLVVEKIPKKIRMKFLD